MGRPREFDISQALRSATDLFWRKGYDNTSLNELTRAMKITPPSFYAAFGSKEGLFQRIVDSYQKEQSEIVNKALRQESLQDVWRSLALGFAKFLTDPSHPPGCLVLNSAIPVTEEHSFRKTFAEQRRALRLALEKRFRQLTHEKASLPPGANPATLAQMLVSLIWGMAVEAQSGATRTELLRTAETSTRLISAGADNHPQSAGPVK